MKPANPNANIQQAYPRGRWTASGTREQGKPSHTPGPWKADGFDKGTIIVSSQWGSICRVLDNGDIGQRNANSRLIAESPAMLEALRESLAEMQAFRKYWTSPNMGLKRDECSAEEKVRAILARIEGKEQTP